MVDPVRKLRKTNRKGYFSMHIYIIIHRNLVGVNRVWCLLLINLLGCDALYKTTNGP